MIVPDLRGFGDSDLAPDGFYDPAAHARDLHALVHDVLGHPSCVAAAGDLGGVVVQDLGLRFPGFVVRQCIFNTLLPILPDAYAAAGVPPDPPRHLRPESDYFLRQATDADGLAAELDTSARRGRYVETFYGSRFWGAPGAFGAEDVAVHVEPFLDADRFRASIANYEPAMGRRAVSEPVMFFEPNPVPTLVLFDRGPWSAARSWRRQSAFPERVGPFVVPGAATSCSGSGRTLQPGDDLVLSRSDRALRLSSALRFSSSPLRHDREARLQAHHGRASATPHNHGASSRSTPS